MGGVTRMRDWSRRVALAAALVFWALSGLSSLSSPQAGPGASFQQAHKCAPSSESGDGQLPSQHHHCGSCVLCNVRDADHSYVTSGEQHFDFAPRRFALANWPVVGIIGFHRQDLIAQQPRAPPFFS